MPPVAGSSTPGASKLRGRAAGRGRRSTPLRTRSRSRSSSSRTTGSFGSRNRTKEPEMSVERDRPYAQFNFLVDLGTGVTDGPQAGFEECSEIGMSVDVVEYRNGNAKENSVQKLTGLARYPDVTLKRGVIGSLDLYSWLDEIRNGDVAAYRTVTIQLMNED